MYNQDLDSEILKIMLYQSLIDFPGSSNGKESARNVGDTGLIPGRGRSPRELVTILRIWFVYQIPIYSLL